MVQLPTAPQSYTRRGVCRPQRYELGASVEVRTLGARPRFFFAPHPQGGSPKERGAGSACKVLLWQSHTKLLPSYFRLASELLPFYSTSMEYYSTSMEWFEDYFALRLFSLWDKTQSHGFSIIPASERGRAQVQASLYRAGYSGGHTDNGGGVAGCGCGQDRQGLRQDGR